jgi:LuxR family quorum sensing-dependent transcriptional regulator
MTIRRDAIEFTEKLESLSTIDEVMDAVQFAMARFGFEHVIVAGLAREQNFKQSVLGVRWPPEFLSVYAREDYIRDDPVARMARCSTYPFVWDEGCYDRVSDPRAAKVMDLAADFRIRRGFLIPVPGPPPYYDAAVSMSGLEIELLPWQRPAVHFMALYVFEHLRKLINPIPMNNRQLTRREREVLTWTAHGKSAWEIGEILHIAKRTVDEHAQTAFRKLGAVNRTQAVAIALRDHLIEI